MILIDEKGEEHKHTFGETVTGRQAAKIIISLKDLFKFEPEETVEYIQTVMASRLIPRGSISIVLDYDKSQQ
ncbi:hypothetical protein KAR91_48165 [Candidatus Pacearchaeota archaeon]|nr:hypothetical protein [Candidatus Pacearchaeota archaeon]